MVYALRYQPARSSYPNAELVEGRDRLVVEDQAPDKGIPVCRSPGKSGRRVRPESVPKIIRRYGRRRLLDFEGQFVATVSDRFRRLIEEIEPGVHQFEPVRYINRDSELYEERWFWQVCNRLDSIDRERSNGHLDRGVYRAPEGGRLRLIFNLKAIGQAKFWCDMHRGLLGQLCANDVRERLAAERITGLYYHYYDQA